MPEEISVSIDLPEVVETPPLVDPPPAVVIVPSSEPTEIYTRLGAIESWQSQTDTKILEISTNIQTLMNPPVVVVPEPEALTELPSETIPEDADDAEPGELTVSSDTPMAQPVKNQGGRKRTLGLGNLVRRRNR